MELKSRVADPFFLSASDPDPDRYFEKCRILFERPWFDPVSS